MNCGQTLAIDSLRSAINLLIRGLGETGNDALWTFYFAEGQFDLAEDWLDFAWTNVIERIA